MQDLAATAIATVTPYLWEIGEGVVRIAAAESLYELIELAFRGAGAEAAWNEYVSDPQSPVVVERILAAALRGDPALTQDIERAVTEVTDNSRQRINTNQSNAQAHGGGSIVGGNQNTSHTRHSWGGVVAVIAVVIVAVVAILAGKAVYDTVQKSGLDANSTCADFLRADQQTELTALREVGVEKGVSGIGSPLALPAISYACSSEPDALLGDMVVRYKGQF
jgi:hypothetical protein